MDSRRANEKTRAAHNQSACATRITGGYVGQRIIDCGTRTPPAIVACMSPPSSHDLSNSPSPTGWGPPYLLYLGDAHDDLAIKTARGLAYWRPQWCLGQLRGPDCQAWLDLPDMTLDAARAAGANTMVVGTANAGGVMSPRTVRDIVAAIEA